MRDRYDFLIACRNLIAPLVKAVASHDMKNAESTYNQLHDLYKKAVEQINQTQIKDWLKTEIFRELQKEIYYSVYIFGSHTPASSSQQPGIRHAVEWTMDIDSIEAIIKTLKHCIDEFNKKDNAYFFMEKDLSVTEFLATTLDHHPGTSAIIIAIRASRSSSNNEKGKNTKKLCDVIDCFLQHGADINKHPVLKEANELLVPFLLKAGANPNANSPIIQFVERRECKAVKELIDYKAEYKNLASDNQSILHIAVNALPSKYATNDAEEILNSIQFITSLDATLLAHKDKCGRVPLSIAVTSSMTASVELLLKLHQENNIPISEAIKRDCMERALGSLGKEPKSRNGFFDFGNESAEQEKERLKQTFKLLLNRWGSESVINIIANEKYSHFFNDALLNKLNAIILETEQEALQKAKPDFLNLFSLWRPGHYGEAIRNLFPLIGEYASDADNKVKPNKS